MKRMVLTLAADLSGPHPEAFGVKFKYLLVVVAIDKGGRKLPFARGLKTKTGEETSEALESIIKELRCLDPLVEMVRFHTDAGKEFLDQWVSENLGLPSIPHCLLLVAHFHVRPHVLAPGNPCALHPGRTGR